MKISTNIKHAICELFDVHEDEDGVQRVVTPLEYSGMGDRIVVRVRPTTTGFLIDENGEAAFYAGLSGGDVESDAISRWADELNKPVRFGEDETLSATANDERLVAPYVLRVAEAAQQLYSIATARVDRQSSDFKERIKEMMQEVAGENNIKLTSDVILPIAGDFKADHVLGESIPIIVIAATSATRLLEAQLIYMKYREEKRKGVVFAVAESQDIVGKKQYERAAYYTDKALIFQHDALKQFIAKEASLHLH